MTNKTSKQPAITLAFQPISVAPRPSGYERRIKQIAEDVAFVAALSQWAELGLFERLWLYVSYPFRRKQ